MNKNTGNYFNDISFETEVYTGLYWIPINSLGKTKYTYEDMEQILKLPIEIRKKKIHNLYEAIQLFHVFDFKGIFDNVDFWIDIYIGKLIKHEKKLYFLMEDVVPRIQIGYLILSVTDMSA